VRLSVPPVSNTIGGILNIYSKGEVRTFGPAQIELARFAPRRRSTSKMLAIPAEREQRALAEPCARPLPPSAAADLDQVLDTFWNR